MFLTVLSLGPIVIPNEDFVLINAGIIVREY